MKEDFTDRLLDSALRHYSSVEVPEGFAERLAARQEMGDGRRWWWMLFPAAAALAMVLVFWPRPTPTTVAPPAKVITAIPLAPIPALPRASRTAAPARPRWRTWSAKELAAADFPLEILRPLEERPLKNLEVPELAIKPLAGAEEETVPKEPQL